MKVRTAIISIVVSAALVAGAGYGAYYAMQGKKSPVEVVPVSNVNTGGYWGMDSSIYGTVTSQIAQNISLNEEYPISEIYVKVGDRVKEGTPLFSYDMTLQELELEMEQLTLQVYELTMTKLEKDLQKLKHTSATASLESTGSFMTTAAEDALIIEDVEVLDEGQMFYEDDDFSELSTESSTQEQPVSTEAQTNVSENHADSVSEQSDESLKIETIESMADSEEEKARLAVWDSVNSYEQVVTAIDSLFRAYGNDLCSEDVRSAISEAAAYYLKHLASEQIATVSDENGEKQEERKYVIREEVQKALGEEGTALLMQYANLLELYQIWCMELMITEASNLEGEALLTALENLESFYQMISSAGQKKVGNTELWQELRVQSVHKAEESESEVVAVLPDETLNDSSFDAMEPEQNDTVDETDGQSESSGESESEGQSESSGEENLNGVSETSGETTESDQSELSSEVNQTYTIDVQEPGSANVSSAAAGDVVVIHTDAAVTGTEFAGWTAQSDGAEIDISLLENLEPMQTDTSFVMPEMNLLLIPTYRIVPSELDGFISSFEELAAKVMEEGAEKDPEYLTMLGDAINFYQQWLSETEAEILDETSTVPSMEEYLLKRDVKEYLTAQNRAEEIEKLQASYKEICKEFVKTMVSSLNPKALTRDAWQKASDAYNNIGITWQAELEDAWLVEQQDKQNQESSVPNMTQTELSEEGDEEMSEEDMSDDMDENQTQEPVILTIAELLQAYEVILIIQELDLTKAEELLRLDLSVAQEKYLALTEAQQSVVWNASILIEALNAMGMWDEQPETQPFPDDFPGFDGGDFDDFSEGYTADELKEMIQDKEWELKECELSVRESKLAVQQCQQVVDGKIVKSTMEGTVVSIGDLDGNSEGDYFAKVTNEEGLYAKGAMNELSLETIHVGDRISGMMLDTGVSFTAVIKEISQYPNADNDSMYYGYGSENTNASYYPFYALLDDTTDIDEGEAEIQLSETMTSSEDSIYLEKYFIRSDNTGKSYVYIQGEDGKLKKQYVTTGKLMYGFALEVVSGLEMSDKIAFPYGKDVFEGAATKTVDMLSAYM